MPAKMADLQATLDIYASDILAIAETHHIEDPPEINGYTFHGRPTDSTHKSGTGILLKQSNCDVQSCNLTHPDPGINSRITAVIYNNTFIIEAYAPCEGKPTDDFYQYLHAHMCEATTRKKAVIVVGDFNGHIMGWSSSNSNKNGKALIHFANHWNLQILPNERITFTGRHGEETCIDYVLVPRGNEI